MFIVYSLILMDGQGLEDFFPWLFPISQTHFRISFISVHSRFLIFFTLISDYGYFYICVQIALISDLEYSNDILIKFHYFSRVVICLLMLLYVIVCENPWILHKLPPKNISLFNNL